MTHRLVSGQRCVAGHEEVEAGCRDEGRNEADQVVVHVAGVAQGGCARRHDGGNLGSREKQPRSERANPELRSDCHASV